MKEAAGVPRPAAPGLIDNVRTEQVIALVRLGAAGFLALQTSLLLPPARNLAYLLALLLGLHAVVTLAVSHRLATTRLQVAGLLALALDMLVTGAVLGIYSVLPNDLTWVVFLLVAAEATTRCGIKGAGALIGFFVVVDVPVQLAAQRWYGIAAPLSGITFRVGLVALMAVLLGAVTEDRNRSRREVEHQLKEFAALREVSAVISSEPDRDVVLGRLLRALMTAVEGDGALCSLLDEEREVLLVQRPVLGFIAEGAGAEVPLHGSLQGRVALQRKLLRSEEVATDPRTLSTMARPLGVTRAMCAPMEVEGRLLGVVTVTRRTGAPFTADDERLMALVTGQIGVIFENARLHEETRQLATTDELTGLQNRRAFMQAVTRETSRAMRFHEWFTILALDLDGLKIINDRGGHQAGDRALVQLAQVLRSEVRAMDLVARVGGDEFVILMPLAGAVEARLTAERIRLSVAATSTEVAPGALVHSSVSIGGIVASTGTPEFLLNKADDCLYRAKAQGRNRVVLEELRTEGENLS